METLFFAWPGNEILCEKIRVLNNGLKGEADWGRFPDGESKFRLRSEVRGRRIAIVCSLNRPDEKLSGLYIFSRLLREYGAARIILIAPYLPYMRQDKMFNPGEGISAKYCAELISSISDELITMDPHLHRISRLEDVYQIPCNTLHAAPLLADYIKSAIKDPVLIGPDSESEQWVSQVASGVGCKFTVLEKIRQGDRQVQVRMKDEGILAKRRPVLVDDIVSTGRTMIETILHLKELQLEKPVCVAVHAVFAEDSYRQIFEAGAADVVSCNGILHPSNKIDVSTLFKLPAV